MNRIKNLLASTGCRVGAGTTAAEKTWTCSQCGQEVPPRALPDGRYLRRSRCACEWETYRARQVEVQREQQQVLRELSYVWIGRKWAEMGLSQKMFANFQRERQPQAFDYARRFVTDTRGVLALYGGYGVGKTHLLAAIANAVRISGRTCLFASTVMLFQAIQERVSNGRSYHELLERALRTPLLLLDDLDKPKWSEFREETYYTIIDARTREGRPLAITSNCTPLEWDRWIGGAARSRLMMGLMPVELCGTDYRLEPPP